jgi:hypothetical protein
LDGSRPFFFFFSVFFLLLCSPLFLFSSSVSHDAIVVCAAVALKAVLLVVFCCCFSCLCRGACFCLFFNGVAAGEEDGELRKNDDGVGSAGVFVMENGSGSQLGRKR